MSLYILIFAFSLLIASRIQPLNAENGIGERYLAGALQTSGYHKKNRQMVVNSIAFFALALFLSAYCVLRVRTGNDYQTYCNHFHDIYYGNYVVTEPGFNFIVKAVYWFLDEENYLWVFGIFGSLTIYIFLGSLYRQSQEFLLSFFLFMTLGIYFQTFNTVRYYFALAIALYSIQFVLRNEYAKFVLLILTAALFHKSVLVVIPLYFLARVPWKKWMVGCVLAFSLTGLFFSEIYMDLLLRLYPSYLEQRELLGEQGISYVNILRSLAVLVLALYVYYRRGGFENSSLWFYFYLNLGCLILYTCFSFIPFVSRIGYYMSISHLLYIPALIKSLAPGKERYTIKAIVIVGALLYFILFLDRAYEMNIRILPYSTWLYDDLQMLPLEHR